jgi:hypothetical protein
MVKKAKSKKAAAKKTARKTISDLRAARRQVFKKRK